MPRPLHYTAILLTCLLAGCFDPPQPPPQPQQEAAPAVDAAAQPLVQPFEPDAGKAIVDPTRPITDPITGPLAALQNAREKIPQLAIEHAINLFNASEGRYPASFEEFMTRIIRENNINLPKLPDGLAWEYDVPNHKLLIVQSK